MSARTAISGFWLPLALIGSVRQITEPTYCLPLGSDGSSSYSTTRCATGATFSLDDGWPTRSGIFGRDCGAAGSFGASATWEDLNRPLTAVTADLPHRMPAPTRMSTMPTAIALLNGNTVPARAALLRLAVAILREPRALTRRRHLRRLRRVTVGLRQRFVIRIGRVGIGAAVLHVRLEPVEFRRGRRHVGIGLSRGAIGLRRGAAEIVGVGGDVAETAHAGRLRRHRRRHHFRGRGGGRCRCRARGAAVAAGRHPASESAAAAGAARRAAAHRHADCAAGVARPGQAADGPRARGIEKADADAAYRAARPEGLRIPAAGHWRGGKRRRRARHRCRRPAARPRGRAGRLPIRPCARLLPATAARG